jgi:hypothetical protein
MISQMVLRDRESPNQLKECKRCLQGAITGTEIPLGLESNSAVTPCSITARLVHCLDNRG